MERHIEEMVNDAIERVRELGLEGVDVSRAEIIPVVQRLIGEGVVDGSTLLSREARYMRPVERKAFAMGLLHEVIRCDLAMNKVENLPRPVNAAGVDLVKHFEGLELEAYRCPAGVWTIGWGHTADVVPGMLITIDDAEEFLRQDLETAGKAVLEHVHVPLNDNQFAALCSFTLNVGGGALRTSRAVTATLNAGDYDAAADGLLLWCKYTDPRSGKKVVSNGLLRRRRAERELFLRETGERWLESQAVPDGEEE